MVITCQAIVTGFPMHPSSTAPACHGAARSPWLVPGLLALTLAPAPFARTQEPAFQSEANVMITTRDGTKLAANIFRVRSAGCGVRNWGQLSSLLVLVLVLVVVPRPRRFMAGEQVRTEHETSQEPPPPIPLPTPASRGEGETRLAALNIGVVRAKNSVLHPSRRPRTTSARAQKLLEAGLRQRVPRIDLESGPIVGLRLVEAPL